MTANPHRILLTGATGYVGGRLLPLLEHMAESGDYSIRCLTRRKAQLEPQVAANTEVVQGDVLTPETLDRALQDVDTAYYLVHSMGDQDDFETKDRRAAQNFADACRRQNVKRIIYLGGLGNPDHQLSKHLRSRQEIGNILRGSSTGMIEFRASIIIGSGSLSFEMIRALVERLPVMICPRWVDVKAQPIAIEDVLAYLTEVLKLPVGKTIVFEIGGPDQVSYGGIMRLYARQRGLRRWMIPVPFLTPYLSSLWLGLVTPLYSRIGRKLVDSLRNPTLISNNLADRYFQIRPRSTAQAIDRALVNEDREFAETRWSDALSAAGEQRGWGGIRLGSRLVDSRSRVVPVPPAQAFTPIRQIGGNRGWYYGDWLWHLRGFLDLLVGGVGIRRGRKHPDHLHVGDAVDCWRVESFEANRLLRLSAEMKVPGRAWLEFEVTPHPEGSEIRQTALFDPLGLAGRFYWYGVWPLHQFVFAGMLRNIAQASLTAESQPSGSMNDDQQYQRLGPDHGQLVSSGSGERRSETP